METQATIPQAELFVNELENCPLIVYGPFAMYDPEGDLIVVPKRDTFNSLEEYYNTVFHELIHSTMHRKRLNRKVSRKEEEIIADLGANYLCLKLNFDTSALKVYVDNKAEILAIVDSKSDRLTEILIHVKRAVDYLLNGAPKP